MISGASIAGRALGYWLQLYGFAVTIVEQAPALRTGGYKIDIRGKAIDVVKKMGLYEEARKFNIVMLGGSLLDEKGRLIEQIPAEHMGMHVGDDLELLRSDLGRVLYHATDNCCEYLFGDSIRSVEQNSDEIRVEFATGQVRRFDILIGADGIHPNVRSLVFGNESLFSHNLGDYYVAICSIETELKRNRTNFSTPKSASSLTSIASTLGKRPKRSLSFERQA